MPWLRPSLAVLALCAGAPAQATAEAPPIGPLVDPVPAAVHWLARAQLDSGAFAAADGEDAIEVTALALLAFLAADSDLRGGAHRDAVKRATSWLMDQQSGTGRFGDWAAPNARRNQAVATLAVGEACALSDLDSLRTAARLGTQHLIDAFPQRPAAEPGAAATLGFELLALAAMRSNALPEDAYATELRRRVAWTDPLDYADVEVLAAVGLWLRGMLGDAEQGGGRVQRHVLLGAALDAAGKPVERVDPVQCLFLANAAVRGRDDAFATWHRALVAALVAAQLPDGPNAGSWPPVEGLGRARATAAAVLVLRAGRPRQVRTIVGNVSAPATSPLFGQGR